MTFPKFEDWTPPWGDDDEEFDAKKAKGLIYSLSKDKDTSKTKLDTAKAEKTAVEEQLKEKSDELAEVQAKGNEQEVTKLQGQVTELTGKLKKAERTVLVQKVADDKGIPLAQAHRLAGDTEDELSEDADAFLKAFGSGKPKEGEEEEEEEAYDASGARTNPQNPATKRKHDPAPPAKIDISDIPRP